MAIRELDKIPTKALMARITAELEGLIVTDADGRYIYVNHRWSSLTGYTLDQVKGRYVRDIVRNSRVDEVLKSQKFVSGDAVLLNICTNEEVPVYCSYILLSKHQLLHVLTERNGIAVFIIPPLIQFDFNDLRGIRAVIAEIFIEQLKKQHRFSASADAGNDFDLAIPHITNEPIQIIVALNHFFHLELVTHTSLLIG